MITNSGITNLCNSFKYFVFDINSLKYDSHIRSCYFGIGDQLFQQRIGIPMTSDLAPFLAKVFILMFFLFFYEWKYISKLTKKNVTRAINYFID